MNRTYRTLWNTATQSWVAVSEISSARGKRTQCRARANGVTVALLAAGVLAAAAPAWANCVITGNTTDCSGATPAGADLVGGVLNNSGTLGSSTLNGPAVLGFVGVGTVNNSGSILSGNSGVLLMSGGAVNNTGGTIRSTLDSVYTAGAAGALNNTLGGYIESTSGYGARVFSSGTVVNSSNSTIVSKESTGVAFVSFASGAKFELANAAGSTITGAGTGVSTSKGDTKLSNAGQINGAVNLDTAGVNTVTLLGGGQIAGDLSIGSTAGSTLTLSGSGTQLYSQAVTGVTTFGAALVKDGPGTWTLDRAITAISAAVNAGSLAMGAKNALGASTDVSIGSGATLGLQGFDQAIGGLSGAGNVALGSATLSVGGNNTSSSFSGAVSGSGALVKQGSGTLTLGGASSFEGGTTVAQGTLALTGAGSLAGSGALTVAAGGIFNISKLGTGGATVGALAGAGSIFLGTSSLTAGDTTNTTFSGMVSGNGGALVKQGTGTLVLDAINTYTGLTTVQAGKLVVGGSTGQSGARLAGAVNVSLGATLGGHGSIGGSVALATGAHLAPGNSIGMLRVEGDLSLSKGSVLDFEFGTPGSSLSVPGLGDSVVVGGNLALDGATLNVTNTGAMGPGLYNLFSYGGSLAQTNGSIALGTLPAGSFAVQYLAGSKQVNLINLSPGQEPTFWNGNGKASAMQMGGGDGTWSSATPSFTDAAGSLGLPLQPGAGFAIFGGDAGSVTVDNGAGAVTAGGIQFASDGYRLSGDTLTLAATKASPGPVEVRVGDNTAASAGWSATIGNVIAGTDGLQKTGAGTLQLTGANTYTGGTTVKAGTLSVASDAALGDAAGALTLAGGTLKVTGTAFTVLPRSVTLSGAGGTLDVDSALNTLQVTAAVVGTGGLVKTGDGTLSLASANTYSGGTSVNGGTLNAKTSGALGTGPVAVNAGGILALSGNANAGSLSITNESGGVLNLTNNAAADQATVVNKAGGTVSIGTLSSAGTSIGSLSGAGNVSLGAKALTTGMLGTSTEVSGVVSGTGGAVVKVGSGTLTLSGANTYTGGTALHQGRLNVGHGQALGTGVLSMDDDTTLGFSADGVVLANAVKLTGQNDPVIDTGAFSATLAGAITGGGFITKQGTGTLTLSGANSYTGATLVAQGTLKAGATNTLSAASAHSVAPGATLDLAGFDQTVASLANSGTVSLVGTTAGTTLTVNGNYAGSNGVLRLGTVLSGTGPSDRLVINGGTASGKTALQVANLGGLGALTVGNGIEVVAAQGGATTTAQSTKDAFALAGGHVDAGAYEYRLYAADASGAGENWYLRTSTGAGAPTGPTLPGASAAALAPVITYRPEAALYAALPSQLRQGNLAMLGDLRKRVGDDDVKGTATTPIGSERRAWARVLSTDIDIQQAGAVSPKSKGRLTGFQAGTDLLATPEWRAGIYVGQLDGDARVSGFASGIQNLGLGRNDLRSQYVGIYGTYTGSSGFYADAVVQSGRHRYTVEPMMSAGTGCKGNSLLGSIEVGQAFPIGASGWGVEPQLQLIHQHMDLSNSAIAGAVVQPQADNGWIARAGVRVKGQIDTGVGMLQPYGRFNVYKTSSGADIARFVNGATTTDIAARTGGTSTELAGGFTLALSQSTSLYGEVGKLWASGASGGQAKVKSAVNGSLGVRLKW